MRLPRVQDADVKGKRVFVRADLDVPLTQLTTHNSQLTTQIEDDTRLKAGLPTLEYLLNNGAKVIVAGHLGRPKQGLRIKSPPQRDPAMAGDEGLSLEPVAEWLAQQFKVQSSPPKAGPPLAEKFKVDGFDGWKLSDNLYVLENLRFYKGEESNDPEFARQLARLADLYVNDAFTVVHRNHASVVGIAKLLPHYAGLRLQKEVEVLGNVLESPKRPLIVIIGGAKVETKLPLIEKMRAFADHVLVGGKLPQEEEAKGIYAENVVIGKLAIDGTDITKDSVRRFIEIINKVATIVWNGPLGLIREDAIDTEKGTREVAQAIAQSNAYKIVGGGDTIDYLQKLRIIDKFDFVSTGGGAMLAFLSGEKLPGLEVLLQ